MSEERSTPIVAGRDGSPGSGTDDTPATATAAAAEQTGPAGSRADEATFAPSAPEEVTGELIALDFGVNKSIRYHAKRRAFFETLHRVAMLVAVIGGSAAFFALTGEKTRVGQIAALLIVIATALDLVFSLPEKAREHDKLAERFSDLAVELTLAQSRAVDSVRIAELKAKRLALEKLEPTALDALNVICHNEEAEARGYGRNLIYRVGWGQRIFAQIGTFPWFHPIAEA